MLPAEDSSREFAPTRESAWCCDRSRVLGLVVCLTVLVAIAPRRAQGQVAGPWIDADTIDVATSFRFPLDEYANGDLSLLTVSQFPRTSYPKIRFADDGDNKPQREEWWVTTAFNQNHYLPSWNTDRTMPYDNFSSVDSEPDYHPGEDWNSYDPDAPPHLKGGDSDGGRPIYPIARGVVLYSGCAYGHTLVIAHRLSDDELITSFYAHMREASRYERGDAVTPTVPIGYVGNSNGTNCSGTTATHLHFEIRRGTMVRHDPKNGLDLTYPPNMWPASLEPADNGFAFIAENYYSPSHFLLERTAPSSSPPGIPGPLSLAATGVCRSNGSAAIELTWARSLNAQSYDIYRDHAFYVGGLKQLGYIDVGATPGTLYTYTVVATNSNGSRESNSDLAVAPLSCNGAAISGRVKLAGEGLPNVTLLLSGSASLSTATDTAGTFRFDALQKGSFTLTPLRSGCFFVPQFRSLSLGNNRQVFGQDFEGFCAQPNQMPAAAFTMGIPGRTVTSPGELAVAVDAVSGEARVTFVDQSTDEDGEIVYREWRTSTGVLLSENDQTFTWGFTPGIYTVELTVRDDKGETASTSGTVRVVDGPELLTDLSQDSRFAFAAIAELRVDNEGALRIRSVHEHRCGGCSGFDNRLARIAPDGIVTWQTPNLFALFSGDILKPLLAIDDAGRSYVSAVRSTLFGFNADGTVPSGWPVNFELTGCSGAPYVDSMVFDGATGALYVRAALVGLPNCGAALAAVGNGGETVWRNDYPTYTAMGPIVVGPAGGIYTVGRSTFFELFGLDAATGTEVCRAPAPVFQSVVGDEAGTFVSSDNRTITSYDAFCVGTQLFASGSTNIAVIGYADGTILLDESQVPSPPSFSVEPDSDRLMAVSQDGVVLWRSSHIQPRPQVSGFRIPAVNGRIYVLGRDWNENGAQTLFVIRARTGEVERQIRTAGVCDACSVDVSSDGTIYIADANSLRLSVVH